MGGGEVLASGVLRPRGLATDSTLLNLLTATPFATWDPNSTLEEGGVCNGTVAPGGVQASSEGVHHFFKLADYPLATDYILACTLLARFRGRVGDNSSADAADLPEGVAWAIAFVEAGGLGGSGPGLRPISPAEVEDAYGAGLRHPATGLELQGILKAGLPNEDYATNKVGAAGLAREIAFATSIQGRTNSSAGETEGNFYFGGGMAAAIAANGDYITDRDGLMSGNLNKTGRLTVVVSMWRVEPLVEADDREVVLEEACAVVPVLRRAL